MLKEFKEFIARGNILDLAIGVVMGSAFGAIVTSLVNDIIMPIVGVISGGIKFDALSITVGEAQIMYGSFIQAIVNFLIIAVCMFFLIKAMAKFQKKKEEAPAPAPEVSEEVKLMTEIRDILQAQSD
jgi:large conductance mechanosensitive channel